MSDSAYKGFFIVWIEQWSQFFERCNWYTFHPVNIEVEDDRIMGGFEVTVILLGLGFRARWNYAETDEVKHLKDTMSRIKSGEEPTYPLDRPSPL